MVAHIAFTPQRIMCAVLSGMILCMTLQYTMSFQNQNPRKCFFQFLKLEQFSFSLKLNILLDTSDVPQRLKHYLPLFCDMISESPITRNGGKR